MIAERSHIFPQIALNPLLINKFLRNTLFQNSLEKEDEGAGSFLITTQETF